MVHRYLNGVDVLLILLCKNMLCFIFVVEAHNDIFLMAWDQKCKIVRSSFESLIIFQPNLYALQC